MMNIFPPSHFKDRGYFFRTLHVEAPHNHLNSNTESVLTQYHKNNNCNGLHPRMSTDEMLDRNDLFH